MAFIFIALPAAAEGLAGLFGAGAAVGTGAGAATATGLGALGEFGAGTGLTSVTGASLIPSTSALMSSAPAGGILASGAGAAGGAGTGLTMGQLGSGLSAVNAANKLLGGSGSQSVGGYNTISHQNPGANQIPSSVTNSIDLLGNIGATANRSPNEYISAPKVPGSDNMKHFASGDFVIDDDIGGWANQYTYSPVSQIGGNISGPDLSAAYDMGDINPSDITSGKLANSSLFDSGSKLGSGFLDWFKKRNPKTGEMEYDWGKIGLLGLGGAGIASLLSKPSLLPKYQPQTGADVGLGRTLSANYKPWRPGNFAGGGSVVPTKGVAPADLLQNSSGNQGVTMADLQNMASQYGVQLPTRTMADGGIAALSPNPTFPMSQQQTSRYAVPSQMPVSATDVRMAHLSPVAMASGGALGGYSDGGQMLRGPGDGMSDNIPATIGGKQPARLADGEFVVPADVVSHLGNGSTDAGAKQLYKMMDKVRTARTGRKTQGKQIKPSKYIPV